METREIPRQCVEYNKIKLLSVVLTLGNAALLNGIRT